MSNIIYGRDEIVQLHSSWARILQQWDDNKSHEIDSKYFQPISQASRQLMDFSDEIHTIINAVAQEVDNV